MIYLSAISVYNNVILNRESETTSRQSMAHKKRAAKEDLGSLDEETSPSTKKSKKLDSRFGGMTEEEVAKLLLPDHMRPGLDIIFIGINPGLYSAYLGHHYCNANNHFWPCLYESGLVPRKLTYKEDAECMNYGIGFTNIVPRTTRGANELSRKEIREWSKVMIERMKELKPLVACFNGKGIYEIFSGQKCNVGTQEHPLPGTDTVVYVMPSTSGRAATYPRRVDKLKFFIELKALRDSLQQKRGLKPVATTTSSATLPGESTTTSNLGEESAVGNVTESQSTSVPAYTLSSTSSNTGADSAVGNDTETQSTTRVQAHSTCSISTGSLEADPFKPEL